LVPAARQQQRQQHQGVVVAGGAGAGGEAKVVKGPRAHRTCSSWQLIRLRNSGGHVCTHSSQGAEISQCRNQGWGKMGGACMLGGGSVTRG
jgi:hypothetical protein